MPRGQYQRTPRTPGEPIQAEHIEDDTLPGDDEPLPRADPVLEQMAAMQAEINRLKRAAPVVQRKPEGPQVQAQSQEEAQRMAEADVAAGVRPRAILTPDGWYVHREMARQPGSLGNLATAQQG